MIPYSLSWSPQIQFPFGGDVNQDIAPDTRWFFGAIPPGAGVGSIEKEVFETASYGKQLGLILDVLMPLIGEPESEKSERARSELKQLYARIEQLKRDRREELERTAVAVLAKLQRLEPDAAARVVRRFGGSE